MREIEIETKNFYAGIVSYGSLDIERAVEIFLDVDKTGDELAEVVNQFAEDTGTPLKDIDICYVAYEHILQLARNRIEDVLCFDFLNEGQGRDIYTYGNYVCSQYDNTQGLIDEIKERLENLDKEDREQAIKDLKEDKVVNWFLEGIGFDFGGEK
jgi:hypothetical protein